MAAYRFAYISLIVIAAVFSQVYRGPMSSVILITVLILPVVTFVINLIGRFAFTLSFEKNPVIIERGGQIRLQVTVKNRFIFPCSCVYITALTPDIGERKEARLVVSLGPLQKRVLNLSYDAKFRGEYEFSIERAYFYDFFKIFKLRKTFKCGNKVTVTPKIYDIGTGRGLTAESEEESVLQSLDKLGSERSYVRKYGEGDEIKRIHWKLSSKQDDYMVWQTAKNHSDETRIVCDITRHGSDDRLNTFYTDCIFEAALAISLYNVRQKRDTLISFFNGEENNIREFPVSLLDDIYKTSEELAKVKNCEIGHSFAEEAEKPFSDREKSGDIILITHIVNNETAKLAEKLSGVKEFSLILIGEYEEEADRYIKKLNNVNYIIIDPDEFQNEIVKIVCRLYGSSRLML